MLKKFVSSLLAIVLLAGCGSSQSPAASSTCADTAASLVSELGLSDTTKEVSDRIIKGLFFFEDGTITDSSLYIANDKSANMVGVFDTTDMEATKGKIKDYLSTLKSQMQSYYPDEVFKIDNAVQEDNGTRIIVIVCDDLEKAQTDAENALGK